MAVKPILLLGNRDLYKISKQVKHSELESLRPVITDLHDTLMHFRKRYKAGRAIAAPQISMFKRIVYVHIDKPLVLINPKIYSKSKERVELWDDCMSFPEILVKVRRHRRIKIIFRDQEWAKYDETFEGDLAELLQHEIDHLDGILAIKRAIDSKSFALKGQQ